MIRFITAALVAASFTAPLCAASSADLFVKKGAKAAAAGFATPKAQKAAAKAEKVPPLTAQLKSVAPPQITVKTKPMMTPDGLIPSKEKTYDTTNATVIKEGTQTKTLADLLPGEKLKLELSNDGKTANVIEIIEKAAKKKP